MTSSVVQAVLASDFSNRTTDVLRNRWTPAKMRHLVTALQGAPVTIVLDAQTGFAMTDVTLGLPRPGMSHSWKVPVTSRFADGTTQTVGYDLASVGPCIVTKSSRAKRDALDTWREEGSAAIRVARRALPGDLYGKWTAEPGIDSVAVTFESQAEADRGRKVYTRVSLAEVLAEVQS